ncbi:hypothetical protein [Pectinatus haikarae]|uniref:hypothetical protein n=1 Tax=Pectinatus haikarae TaxID=349096 RepID=UPI0018C6394F|nr:hypothetical protein [Pectinatus haikarae]
MKFRRIFVLLPVCVFLFGFHAANAAIANDDNIAVDVVSAGPLPTMIKNRMQASVSVIAGQLMDGRSMDEIDTGKVQYQTIIKDVFDKILIGYTVSDVFISSVNETVNVKVSLLPWNDTIKDVDVQVATDGVSPEIAALALNDIQGLHELFSENLCGLPVDAVDWSNGVLKHSLNDFMEKRLPEFRADFEMRTGEVTGVTVTIYPRMPVVRNIDLAMRSDTVPNLYLLQERSFFQTQTNILLGVPVAFVNRHKDYFAKRLGEALDRRTSFSLLAIHTQVEIRPDEQTMINSYSDTAKYNINIEGWADFGRANNGESMTYKLHAGSFITPKNEFFTQIFFKPQEADLDWAAGYYYHFDNRWRVGGRYFFDNNYWSIDTQRIFNRKWSARFDYAPSQDFWEGAVRYNVHDFVSLEYVWQQSDHKEDKWLRLIGHF